MHYPFDEFASDVRHLARAIRDSFDAQALVAVSRGGMTLGHALAVALANRNLFAINAVHYEGERRLDTVKLFNVPDLSGFARVLLIDDIVDSGETMTAIRALLASRYPAQEVRVASLFYKRGARVQPDFTRHEAHDWLTFFWDITLND